MGNQISTRTTGHILQLWHVTKLKNGKKPSYTWHFRQVKDGVWWYTEYVISKVRANAIEIRCVYHSGGRGFQKCKSVLTLHFNENIASIISEDEGKYSWNQENVEVDIDKRIMDVDNYYEVSFLIVVIRGN